MQTFSFYVNSAMIVELHENGHPDQLRLKLKLVDVFLTHSHNLAVEICLYWLNGHFCLLNQEKNLKPVISEK